MAMEHKAFVFDFRGFDGELRPILEQALRTNDGGELLRFIERHRASLKDPYEGEPLAEDWRDGVESEDAQVFGDYALTKYYEPSEDLGLGPNWEMLQSRLLTRLGNDGAVLGRTVGPADNPFDPGKMGSYFQTEEDVRANLHALLALRNSGAAEEAEHLVRTLRAAAERARGLYVTS
jgi:hypothetical protein